MDVYMPLRIQHQITDTVKECLTSKGKHILGVVDSFICNEFRQKVLNDVGNPNLKQKCYDLIDKLKLEADLLTKD